MYQNRYAQQQQHSVRPRRFNNQGDTEKKKYVLPLYEFLNKRVFIQFKGSTLKISGTLAWFDVFQNLALASAVDESVAGAKVDIGDIVRIRSRAKADAPFLLFSIR